MEGLNPTSYVLLIVCVGPFFVSSRRCWSPPGVQPVKQVSALKGMINEKNTFAHNQDVENWNTSARFEKSSVWCGVLVETTQAAS